MTARNSISVSVGDRVAVKGQGDATVKRLRADGWVEVALDGIEPPYNAYVVTLDILSPAEPTPLPPSVAENVSMVAVGVPRESGVILDAPGYESLARVLTRAFHQAANGKGKERHAKDGAAFEDQPMVRINAMLGSQDGFIYQAIKKAVESKGLPRERAVAELLGSINYLAGAVLALEGGAGRG